MDTVGNIKYVAEVDSSKLTAGLKNIESQVDGAANKTERGGSRMTGALKTVGKAGFMALAATAAAALAAVTANIGRAVNRIDTLVAFPKMLQAMGSSSKEAKKATDQLTKGLEGLPTPLEAGAKGVQALVASGLDVGDATDSYLAFNNAMLAANVEAGAADATFTQLTQAISRGKIEGQEWNSISANMPTALKALSDEAGLSKEGLRELYRTDPQGLLNDLVRLNKQGGGGLASLEDQARTATGGIATSFQNMRTAIARGIEGIVKSLGNGDLETGQRVISGFITSVGTALGDILETVGTALSFATGVISTFTGFFSPLIDYFKNNQLAADVFKNTLIILGGILLGVVLVAIGAVIVIATALVATIELLVGIFTFVGNVAVSTWNLIVNAWNVASGFFGGVASKISTFLINAWNLIKSVWSGVTGFFSGVVNGVISLFSQIPGSITGFFSGAWGAVRGVWGGVSGWFSGVVSSIGSVFGRIVGYVRDAFGQAVSAIKNINWSGIGIDIIKGIGGGIASMGGWLADQASAAVGGAKDRLKEFLKIKSPSQVMRDEVGKMIGLGIGAGIEGTTGSIVKTAESSGKRILGAFDNIASPTVGMEGDESSFNGGGGRTTTIGNVYLANDVDADRFIRRLSDNQATISNGLVPNKRYA